LGFVKVRKPRLVLSASTGHHISNLQPLIHSHINGSSDAMSIDKKEILWEFSRWDRVANFGD
jgi:hypothetical protein